MTATIIPFPHKKKEPETAYRIPLYGDAEVKLTVAVVNMFGEQVAGVTFDYATPRTLKNYSPEFVIACIKLAHASDLFSNQGRKALNKILLAVEEVKVS